MTARKSRPERSRAKSSMSCPWTSSRPASRFIAAKSLEATYPLLKAQWWGTPASLHLDCWAEITRADGYRIHLKPEPSESPLKLYFVNLGGYTEKDFAEVHKNVFVVAESPSKAKVRALKTVRHWESSHQDDFYEAESCFALNDLLAAENRLYIHLEKIGDDSQPPFTCRYIKLGR